MSKHFRFTPALSIKPKNISKISSMTPLVESFNTEHWTILRNFLKNHLANKCMVLYETWRLIYFKNHRINSPVCWMKTFYEWKRPPNSFAKYSPYWNVKKLQNIHNNEKQEISVYSLLYITHSSTQCFDGDFAILYIVIIYISAIQGSGQIQQCKNIWLSRWYLQNRWK